MRAAIWFSVLFLVVCVAGANAASNGKIWFVKNGGIYSMDPDGSNLSPLLAVGAWPHLSPDGTKVVFSQGISGNDFDIFVMNADGTNPVNLTQNPASDYYPRWSPDGTKILFSSNRNGGDFEIYVMNADGSGVTNLSNDPLYWQGEGKWSPDGQKIVYWSQTATVPQIFVMNANGSNQTNISNNSTIVGDFSPSWSPDGQQIAFTRDVPVPGTVFNGEVYKMNADGSNQTNLTNALGWDGVPDWSPDGTKIVFLSERDGNDELYLMNADGTGQTNITNSPTTWDVSPSWARFLSSVCPQPQGYWKNTPQLWPVNSLPLGSQFYTQTELIQIMQMPTKKDASLILAQQLIAAKLNIYSGVNPAPVQNTIANADQLLATFVGKLPYNTLSNSPAGQSMVSYSNGLEQFNRGYLTAGCQP